MRCVILSLFLCASALAETYRLQSVDNGITCHGNSFAVARDAVVTCLHLIENGEHRIQVNDEWIRAEVIAKDVDNDLCLLKIGKKVLEPVEFKKDKPITVSGTETRVILPEGKLQHTARKYDVEIKRSVLKSSCNIGISGSPVKEDGKVIGIIISVDKRENATESTLVPSSIIQKFVETASARTTTR